MLENKILSTSAKNALLWTGNKGIDDLFTEKALDILKQVPNSVLGGKFRKTKKAEENFAILYSQLPDGIYNSLNELINLASNSISRVNTDSVTYSPLVLTFKEFNCCKVMKYRRGNIITGRDREIDDVLLTLCKKNKRGAILVGEPGVGKTAIVNAINAKLIQRTVPRQLIGCQIFNLDIPTVFTNHKEDPIGTIIGVLERASKYDKAILFIDEVHQLLSQKMNDIMKPYLTEKIRFIGSTTLSEYHSIITEDTALERRFSLVHVGEPNVEKTIGMVSGTKSVYEEYHKCTIPDDICKYLVETGSRFQGHRRNPDKSLDLLDISCSIMDDKEVKDIYVEGQAGKDFLDNLEIQSQEVKSIHTIAGERTLSKKYVNLAISQITGIAYDEIANSLEYNQVQKDIKSKVYGQDEPVETLANIVNIFKHVKYDRTRPVSVVLTVGPPGVGKKTACKLLAKNLFGKTTSFIDYDMSAFKDGFAITELKGSPPGYVGYSKSGGLIKALRNNPQSVAYFRGINKAHETIRQYIIDGCRVGKLVDSAERVASLNNTVIVLSVTLPKSQLNDLKKNQNRSMGFGKTDKKSNSALSRESLAEVIGKELVTACDEIIIFSELGEAELEKIYNENVKEYLDMYNVDIDQKVLKKAVLDSAENGHDIVARLSSEVPRLVFKQLKNKGKNK